jgi:CBS domain containing-hemolysin-like protein
MSVLERIPMVGDEVETAGGTLKVVRMDGRRVERVEFTPAPAEAEDGGDR